MKKLLCLLTALLLLCLSASALAAEPAVPADEALVRELLPDYTLVEGNIHNNELRLLMTRPDGALVFVGAVQDDAGQWHLHESSPLPEDTILGVENFVHSLGIPANGYYHCVSVKPYADHTWGVSMIYPENGSLFLLGKDWISNGVHAFEGTFGAHPWSNIAGMDWSALPQSYEEAVDALDTLDFAVVNNPDPADRLHLRAKPDRDAESQGKFYSGTPVRIIEQGEEWTMVAVAGMEGWMMTKYLVFGDEMASVEYAGPWLDWKSEETQLYSGPDKNALLRTITGGQFFVIGAHGDDWYIIWLPDSDEYAYVRQDDLWPGNG